MYACDFEYDGLTLSSFGFVICEIGGSSGFDTVGIGSNISFNTTSMHSGKVWGLAGAEYSDCIETSFYICKDNSSSDLQISNSEIRSLARWLNRREFLKFKFINEDPTAEDCYYDASFNINKSLISKEVYALELEMKTNRPFGYGIEKSLSWIVTGSSQTYSFDDTSDEIGYIYPSLVIVCKQAGDLSISDDVEDGTMLIKNCSVDEVITIDGQSHVINSSLDSHHLYDDFNFEFLKIGNRLNNKTNTITVSLPCEITLKYNPIIKNSPD